MAAWGRWGQQWAIARYPYLKKEGKGRFSQGGAAWCEIHAAKPIRNRAVERGLRLARLSAVAGCLAIGCRAGLRYR